MSNSRLEKFIYAICSMEVSDLPAPLSRIEILWNCLITGETPDFEPQSRNEKYLMAMLGLYELDQLPTPMSRGEKLLYKIAVGETDLSDVPGYLSRYEELLKYLIENGVLSDFEYVLYTLNKSLSTLYATVEKPVKSAILKGQTLVNVASLYQRHYNYTDYNLSFIDKTKTYFIKFNTTFETTQIGFIVDDSTWNINIQFEATTNGYVKIKPNETKEVNRLRIRFNGNTDNSFAPTANLICVEYQEGMENWDIPYFEGMQSVKLPVLKTVGKNLFEKSKVYYNSSLNNNGEQTYNTNYVVTDYIEVSSNKTYVSNKLDVVAFYDSNKKFISMINAPASPRNFTTPSNCKYIRVRNYATLPSLEEKQNVIEALQIELGTEPTSYEPHKSNILTVNEDVVLRGIGDVSDELDCLTGEATERIGEIVLDGSENWKAMITVNGTYRYATTDKTTNVLSPSHDNELVNALSNRLPITTGSSSWNNAVGLCNHVNSGWVIYDGINTDLNSFKEWISQNPITIQFQLATESIKTVDLTAVDQDGQPTKLKTFNDISHVEINADNLIPSVDVEVATKISETLATLDPQQLDISETQNKLGQTINEQTENTDATMMATTEIYEQTL